MRKAIALVAALMAGGPHTYAAPSANALIMVPTLSSLRAVQAASAARVACATMGFRVSVSVVDAAGILLTTIRDDGAAPHTVVASQRKAYTALTTRKPTSEMVKILSANADSFGLRQIDGVLFLSGGIPLKVADSVVGAIGVSGAPGPDGDEKCGAAGIAAIADGLSAAK